MLRGLGESSISSLISSLAPSYGVPSSLALAVAQRESGLNQGARGAAGEVGVFQLMPGTAADLGVNPADLQQNIAGGLSYLAKLYQQFGDWGTALEAYNGGPGNVTRGTVSQAARDYSSSILAAIGNVSGDTSSDFAFQSPTTDSGGVFDAMDLSSVTGLSGVAIAALALVILAGLVLAFRD